MTKSEALERRDAIMLSLVDLEYGWKDIPLAFRHVKGKDALRRLIRNAETVYVSVDALNVYVKVSKPVAISVVSENDNDDALFVATYNGLDLSIHGIADVALYDDEGNER